MGDFMINTNDLKKVLEDKISESKQVILTGHTGADFDSIASCIAMSEIAKKFKTDVYILHNDPLVKIEPGIKEMIDNTNSTINYINNEEYKKIKTNSDLLITLDVSNIELLPCKEFIDSFKNIIVIDHHKENENTIKTKFKYIDSTISSASEIMTNLLISYKINFTKNIANYLLTGIYLDTNKYTKNCSSKTMNMVSRLLDRGADIAKVNEFFETDFESDRKVQDLVSKANFITYSIAICIADDTVTYTKEELAKVADYLLRFKADAAFAAGFIDNELISISARSKGKVDVSKIMNIMCGGGNKYSAATKINSNDLTSEGKKLEKLTKPNFYIEEN